MGNCVIKKRKGQARPYRESIETIEIYKKLELSRQAKQCMSDENRQKILRLKDMKAPTLCLSKSLLYNSRLIRISGH